MAPVTERDLFAYALVAGGVSLAVAVLAVVFGGTAFASACALIGIGFMVGALALAVYEQRDKGA
jgi:hypothetical protein